MTTPMQGAEGRLAVEVNERDHVLGSADAPVTLVEYGDYQCPYCGMAHPVIQELLRRRRDSLLFAFRHFPLSNVHPYAELAADAAEAAGARGRFWAMHDWLYDNQSEIDPVSLITALAALGLDSEVVTEEIRSHRYAGKIRDDFIGGIRSGVNGTPTFFINGVRHEGGYSLDELELAIDQATGAPAPGRRSRTL
jgi:protein-disulfide isomerase